MPCCGGKKDGAAEAERLYALLQEDPDCHSLLKKHLTPELLNSLKSKKTKLGGTLSECIRSGCENTDSGVGIYACDPQAYTTFAPLFDEIIKDYHQVTTLDHPETDFGDIDGLDFENLDPSGQMIISTRVRVGRSHEGFSFPPTLNNNNRLKMEKKFIQALTVLTDDLKGTYHSLADMTPEMKQELMDQHYLFSDSDRFLRSAGGYNSWPSGRGIFYNDDKTFLVWVNEEDHLRIISMQQGGNLKEVYARLVKAVMAMERSGLIFAKKKGIGYLTFCPSNLGTALRASVHVKIPHLSRTATFEEFCDQHHIQARGVHGEHTESEGGVYDISNKRRLGLTEFEAIQEMRKGVEAVLAEEQSLAQPKPKARSKHLF